MIPGPELIFTVEEIRVWQSRLNFPQQRLRELAATLADDERARAAAFRFETHRNRFIAARGLLREILARATGAKAAEIAFSYRPLGKPYLAATNPAAASIHFNLSHSGGLFLCAVSPRREVGIDVERIRFDIDAAELAPHCLAEEEAAAVRQAATPERERLFFRYWTRREARVKATGEGLLSAPAGASASGNATLFDLPAEPGFAAALAVKERPGEGRQE